MKQMDNQKKQLHIAQADECSTDHKLSIDEQLDEINDLAVLARLFPENMSEYHERREKVKDKLSATVTRQGDRDEK
ncbi:hypothetical protein GCM10011571_17460 [Marinithermofilum abyssi]|uniref:Uncharacterized protein n=1 Tax=Marinithermofilum abyssi TaxID=1571185 RepID=A0A8J2Y969_9BACL|nr:hypothetical protein [Marinithermofilum abyssi]GGE16307.1 hypothetical protein GCM10011571_17460 [Marinithermofilum abyssi]